MPEGLLDPTAGTALPIAPAGDGEAAFYAAMAEPEPGPAEPPKREVDAEAPFGRTKDGKPKRGPGGRPPRPEKPAEDKPRVQEAPKGSKDYREPLMGVMQLLWGVTAPVAPADAAAVKLATPGVVSAWNALAQENAAVAKGIEWLSTGSTIGAVVMATAPLVLQLAANHGRLPVDRFAGLGVRDPEQLAAMTRRDLEEMLDLAA